MRLPEEFKERLRHKNRQEWIINECPACNYPLRYLFFSGDVFFDENCKCTNDSKDIILVDWKHISDYYNKQPNSIKVAMDINWGFREATVTELINPPKTNLF